MNIFSLLLMRSTVMFSLCSPEVPERNLSPLPPHTHTHARTYTHTFRSPAFPAFLLVPVLCSEPLSLYLVKWPLRHLRWEPWSPVPICLQTLPGGDTRIFPPSGFLLECLGQGLRPRYLLCFTKNQELCVYQLPSSGFARLRPFPAGFQAPQGGQVQGDST